MKVLGTTRLMDCISLIPRIRDLLVEETDIGSTVEVPKITCLTPFITSYCSIRSYGEDVGEDAEQP